MELGLSIVALVVAIGAAVASWSVSKRQTAIQERMLSLESRRERDRVAEQNRAQVRAIIREVRQYSYALFIYNEGAAQARAINVRVDDVNVEDSPQFLRPEQVRVLGAGASAKYHLVVHSGSPTRWDVKIDWEDGTGTPGYWHSELTL